MFPVLESKGVGVVRKLVLEVCTNTPCAFRVTRGINLLELGRSFSYYFCYVY